MQVHLIDGTWELFRAHFGAPPAQDSEGREVGAVRGLLRSLYSLIDREGATHLACAFDSVIESFRNELFAGYKSSEGVPAELLAQFELAEEACRALGVVSWGMVEVEADDALATSAARLAADPRVAQVRICTPDKDLAQSVRGERVVQWDRRKEELRDEAGVLERFGVQPRSIPDWLALVGDSADGIPGIPRWGEKSAAALLRRYEHIEAIPADPDRWEVQVRGAKALSANLEARRADALLYRELATLREDVDLDVRLEGLEWKGADPERLPALCERLRERRLLERIRSWR